MENLKNEISSSAVSPQTEPILGYKDIFFQLEQAIGADVEHVKNFVQLGIITQEQGKYLLAQLTDKAQQINKYKISQQEKPAKLSENVTPKAEIVQNALEIFMSEKPDFFKREGRSNVLNYLKGLDLDKDEIIQISQLVEGLENSAVSDYLKKTAYEKSLNDENALAKSKLTSYAQNAPASNGMNRIFTREQIGAMSGNEFERNEDAIYDQLKHGLIR